MQLLDVNVWLALVFGAHRHHLSAKAWFDTQPADSCMFCRMTQQGFLRLATNPAAVRDNALCLREAWRVYDALVQDERVGYLVEPVCIEEAWRTYTQLQSFSNKVWNDAYLAAFAKTAGICLITFDRGFVYYEDVEKTVLECQTGS